LRQTKIIRAVVALLLLSGLACQKAASPEGNSNTAAAPSNSNSSQVASAPKTHLKVGDQAPDFSLTDTNGKAVKLSDFRGKKNVVLAFYVLAFTGG
jgi:cytochrome oxidase Cu insertion factor (SCO1/SenC/PrrC family)